MARELIRQQKRLPHPGVGRESARKNRVFQRSEKGQMLIEILIALAIMGIVAVAFLTAVTTSSVAIILADEKTTAESLTRTELEYIKNSDYIDYSNSTHVNYGLISGIPAGYNLTVQAVPIDPDTHEPYTEVGGHGYYENDRGLQNITVIVYHQGRLQPVLTTGTYKMSRQ